MNPAMKRGSVLVCGVLLFGGCADRLGPDEKRVAVPIDGSLTATWSAWSEPVNLGPAINTAFPDQGAFVSKDELSLYFASQRPALPGPAGPFGLNDIYVSTRQHKHDPWGPGLNLGSVINTPGTESTPALSRDEKLLFL